MPTGVCALAPSSSGTIFLPSGCDDAMPVTVEVGGTPWYVTALPGSSIDLRGGVATDAGRSDEVRDAGETAV